MVVLIIVGQAEKHSNGPSIRTEKQIVVHSHSIMTFGNEKKNFTPSCNGVDEPHKRYNKWKKPDIQYILYDSSYTKYKIWQNLCGLLEVRIIVTIL